MRTELSVACKTIRGRAVLNWNVAGRKKGGEDSTSEKTELLVWREAQRAGGMAQVVENLPSKHETLVQTPVLQRKRERDIKIRTEQDNVG
jgi:hypothetical protein